MPRDSTAGAEGVEDTVSTRANAGHPDLRHHRHRPSEKPRQRTDLPRVSHPFLLVDPKDARTSTSTSRAALAGPLGERAPGCVGGMPARDPEHGLVPHRGHQGPAGSPERQPSSSSPRIFNDLVAPPKHGEEPEDSIATARKLPAAQGPREGGPVIAGRRGVHTSRPARPDDAGQLRQRCSASRSVHCIARVRPSLVTPTVEVGSA